MFSSSATKRETRKLFFFFFAFVTNKFLYFFFAPFSRHFSIRSSERDNFIKVNWDNIKEQAFFNFKQFSAHVSMFSTPYDYDSIMHYSQRAFAKDRTMPTIIPLRPARNMGQRDGKLLFHNPFAILLMFRLLFRCCQHSDE